MSKIVFFCIPAHGHTNPTLNVVRELIQRGHEVWYYSYRNMQAKIEETGANFIACDDWDTEHRLDPAKFARIGKDLALSTRLLVDTTLALDESVCRAMQQLKPDCIVADSMAVWGKAVALKLGIPFVSSTTTFAFNQHSAKIMKHSLGQLLGMIFAMPKISRDIKRLQQAGYPVQSVLDIIQNDDQTHTIVYTSPEFQPCSDTFSADHYAFVGPSIRPAKGSFAKRADKLVYISMGTVNNNMVPFYRSCIAALADTKYQVLLSMGNAVSPSVLDPLPSNISVCSFVDQIAVLQKADAFLSHCGMNSASESLYHGVPLIMYPQTPEQGGVAERISQLGAGIRLDRADAISIRDSVYKVLSDPIYRENASQIADDMKKCGGAKAAADKILHVANQ